VFIKRELSEIDTCANFALVLNQLTCKLCTVLQVSKVICKICIIVVVAKFANTSF
jgi:hypothetical protein